MDLFMTPKEIYLFDGSKMVENIEYPFIFEGTFRVKGSLPSEKSGASFWKCSENIFKILGDTVYHRGINVLADGKIIIVNSRESIDYYESEIDLSNGVTYTPVGILNEGKPNPVDFLFATWRKKKGVYIVFTKFQDLTFKLDRKKLIEEAETNKQQILFFNDKITVCKTDLSAESALLYNQIHRKLPKTKILDYNSSGKLLRYQNKYIARAPFRIYGAEFILKEGWALIEDKASVKQVVL